MVSRSQDFSGWCTVAYTIATPETEKRVIYGIHDILNILPHRYPFLLVDRIVELEPEKRIVGLKNVTINEEFFQGHFPGAPVMPGVLIIESMAQVAGVMIYRDLPERSDKLIYFTGIENAKFRRQVLPGDQFASKWNCSAAGVILARCKAAPQLTANLQRRPWS